MGAFARVRIDARPVSTRADTPTAGRLDLALGAAGAFAFGCTILFSRTVARDQLPPSVALSIRFGVAGLLLLGVLAVSGRPLLPPPGERLVAFALGFAVYAVESTCFYSGLEHGTAAAVALIFYAYPAVIAVAEVGLGRSRWRVQTLIALVLAVSGSAVVAIGGGRFAISTTGVLCVCGSIVMFSLYVLLGDRVLVRTDSITAATWTAIGASLGTLTFGVVRGSLQAPSGRALAALCANGVATATAFTLFFVVLGRIGATRTAIVMALEAVTGIVLAAIFLGESVRPVVALGGAAVLAGAIIAALTAPAPAPVPVETLESAASP
jgi:drug/metabolite transporter (DMT)-like permease